MLSGSRPGHHMILVNMSSDQASFPSITASIYARVLQLLLDCSSSNFKIWREVQIKEILSKIEPAELEIPKPF